MKITDEQRSMIASAFVSAYDYATSLDENKIRSLCCGPDCVTACAQIVGREHADKLASFFYEELGCNGWKDPEIQNEREQHFLDKIANLEEL